MSDITLKVKKLVPEAEIPKYATFGAACFDIKAAENVAFAPGGVYGVSTGLAFEIPEGYVMLVYSRSGHGFKNQVSLVNSVGVIDSDYRGELKIGLRNDGSDYFQVNQGDRIAQAMLVPLPIVHLYEVEELSDTVRGTGGMGSTGK